MIGQPAIERTLAAHAQAQGVEVHYASPATAIEETPSGVTVTCSGTNQVFHGRFAVGADGSRSLVRQSAGIDFNVSQKDAKNMVWGVMDAVVETDFPQCPEIVSFEKNGQARVQWIPRERGLARLYACMGEGTGRKVTLEETVACVREHLAPHWIEFPEIEWFSSVEGECFYSFGNEKFADEVVMNSQREDRGESCNEGREWAHLLDRGCSAYPLVSRWARSQYWTGGCVRFGMAIGSAGGKGKSSPRNPHRRSTETGSKF